MKIRNPLKLAAAVMLCELAGAIGSLFTFSAIPSWYSTLNKPFFSPPNWVFAPVWITLYALMGIALYLVWEKGLEKKKVKTAAIVFLIQLSLNSLWSILFFGLKSPFYAFFEIVLLWIAIAFTIMKFREVDARAAWLLIPYILWVSFAAILNFSVWTLNP